MCVFRAGSAGCVLCPRDDLIPVVKRFQAKIVTFNPPDVMPILKGHQVRLCPRSVGVGLRESNTAQCHPFPFCLRVRLLTVCFRALDVMAAWEQCVLLTHYLNEPVVVRRIVGIVDRATGEIVNPGKSVRYALLRLWGSPSLPSAPIGFDSQSPRWIHV